MAYLNGCQLPKVRFFAGHHSKLNTGSGFYLAQELLALWPKHKYIVELDEERHF